MHLSNHHHNSGNEQTRHPNCFQCPLCLFLLFFPSNPRSAFCHLQLVCVFSDFTYVESHISCTFQLASSAPTNYFDSHPCCCVYQCFISFLSFSLLSFLPPHLLSLSISLSFCFIVWICHTLFIWLHVDGHVCCFQFLPIETKVVVNLFLYLLL